MKDVAIKLKNISKVFFPNSTLLKGGKDFFALKNINLTIQQGDRVGIIGPNGSGKTTLLNIISGITKPTGGEMTTNGKIVSMMHLDAGFHPELTGKENISSSGLLIGMTKQQITESYKSIVDFADIGSFINSPLYTYSDGMKFRLAFAIAIASKCDILIIDEVFLAGDTDFQLKTLTSIKRTQAENNTTIIVSSHVLGYIMTLSDKYYSLDKGHLKRESTKSMMKRLAEQDSVWREELGVTFGYTKK